MAFILCFVTLAISSLLMGDSFGSGDPAAVPAILAICALLSWPISGWLTGRRDTFDPICLLAIFGVHFFLLGPLYQLSNKFYPYLIWNDTFQSWSTVWFYVQAALIAVTWFFAYVGKAPQTGKEIAPAAPPSVGLRRGYVFWAMAVTFVVKVVTFAYFGGVAGVVDAYQDRLASGVIENNPFAGLGPLVLIGDMFPIALGLYGITRWRNRKWFRTGFGLAIFMLGLLVITLGAVGLRGSRSSVVFAMAIVVLSYHFMVVPLKRRHLAVGAVGLLVFMQGYLAYKFGGFDALFSDTARQQTFSARQLDDGPAFVLIRDFTRMDVQTYALFRVAADNFPLSWGRSLLSGVTAIIPQAIFPDRPVTFILEKTQILAAGRSFDPRSATTLVFGGFGELFINFGWLSFLFAWPFGRLLRRLRATVNAARGDDISALLAPIGCLLPIALLVYDSNSLAYFFIQFCSVSIYLAWRVRRWRRRIARLGNAGQGFQPAVLA